MSEINEKENYLSIVQGGNSNSLEMEDEISIENPKCHLCFAIFNSMPEIYQHLKNVHNLQTCQYCSKTFFQITELIRHIKENHEYSCYIKIPKRLENGKF